MSRAIIGKDILPGRKVYAVECEEGAAMAANPTAIMLPGDIWGRVPQTHRTKTEAHTQAQLVRAAREPEHWQEAHSPTEPAMVREYVKDAATGVMKPEDVPGKARRRKADNRVWAAMTLEQEQAAIRIVRAWDLITGGMGFATTPTEVRDRARQAEEQSDFLAEVEADYFAWGRLCVREDPHMHPITVAWLGDAIPLSTIDERFHKRRGTARKMLFDGLSLYAEMKGWIRNRIIGDKNSA